MNYIAMEDPQETERKETGVLIFDACKDRRCCPYNHLGLEHEQHLPSVDADSVRFTMPCIRRCTQYASTFAFRISTLFRTRCHLASATCTYCTTLHHSTVLLLYPNLILSLQLLTQCTRPLATDDPVTRARDSENLISGLGAQYPVPKQGCLPATQPRTSAQRQSGSVRNPSPH